MAPLGEHTWQKQSRFPIVRHLTWRLVHPVARDDTTSNVSGLVEVVGSTALVQTDEQVAHERIQSAFARLCEIIIRYDGTAHEIRGDALVAEFNRSSDAVTRGIGIPS